MSDALDRSPIGFEGRRLLGHYLVGRRIAEGGMGAVHLAEDTDLVGKSVVVKVPHEHFLADAGFRERFELEIRGLMALEHPHVVRILAQGESEGVPFLVLQHLKGGSLASLLEGAAGGRLAPREVLRWLPDIARALDFVHAKGVLHRDVKPGNILFDEHGHVFLSDFGIAKAIASTGTAVTQTGFAPGSPAYMAPEQAMSATPTGRIDQYALATVVYEALSGTPPHTGDTPFAVLVRKQTHDARPLVSVAPGVPVAASDAVMRALARDPEARFPTCAAFAEAFAAAVEAATPTREGRSALHRASPPTRTSPTAPSVIERAAGAVPPRSSGMRNVVRAIALAAVGVGVAAFLLRGAKEPQAGRGSAEDPLEISIESPAEGEMLPDRHVRVAATIRGLRPSDRVYVHGREVMQQGPWSSRAQVTGGFDLEPSDEPSAEVEVRDGLGQRRAMKTSTFVVQAPPRRSASSTEATTSFLRGWAEPVTDSAIDAATGLPRLVRRTKDGATMALIPAGTFLMGAAPGDLGTRDDESPRHAVTLSRAYYLDVTEVTLAQFKTFAGAVGVVDVPEMTLDGTNDRTPAYNVTFEEARMFASWADVELPTEAQWERAARGGHDGYVYPWGMTDDVKRRNGGGEDDDGFKGIAPARSYEANDYGLFDMAGNVWEWCSDWYGAAYYASSPSADPTGPATGTERILRGSAWNSAAEGGPYDFRVSVRRSAAPTERVFSYGFRCAKRLP